MMLLHWDTFPRLGALGYDAQCHKLQHDRLKVLNENLSYPSSFRL